MKSKIANFLIILSSFIVLSCMVIIGLDWLLFSISGNTIFLDISIVKTAVKIILAGLVFNYGIDIFNHGVTLSKKSENESLDR